ncbi:MAG: hypothetical protein FD180_447 [Planctomycetota bacterium]|nr:MAG: hypothetical protein FD180_447 [Planctomycetota bacterium]
MRGSLVKFATSLLVAAIAGCGSSNEHDDHDHGTGAAHADSETAVDGSARDPACGKLFSIAGQPEFVYRETRFHFCSTACLDTFKAAPSAAMTGLPKEKCICSTGAMKHCGCGHCQDKAERCECGDPQPVDGSGSHGHNHEGSDHK